MIVLPLYSFTGSIAGKVLDPEPFYVYLNELDPGNVEADWYGDYIDYVARFGVDTTSTEKLVQMFGGALEDVRFSFGTRPENPAGNPVLSVLPNALPNTRTYRDHAWVNPANGLYLVAYSHWHTVYTSGDVTFDRVQKTGPHVRSSTFRAVDHSVTNEPDCHIYNDWGLHVGGASIRNIYYIRPGATLRDGFSAMDMIAPALYTQLSEEQDVRRYYHIEGTPWVDGESHTALARIGVIDTISVTSTPPAYAQCYLPKYNGNSERWMRYFLTGSPDGCPKTILYNGVESDEMFFRGSYHYTAWMYKNNQWSHVWGRCPYLPRPYGGV